MTDFGKPWTFPHITRKGFIILVNCKAVSTPHWEHPGWFNNQNFEGKLRDSFSYPLLRPAANMKPPAEKGPSAFFHLSSLLPHFQQPLTPAGLDRQDSGEHRWELASLLSGWVHIHSCHRPRVSVGVGGHFLRLPSLLPLLLKFPRDRQHIPLKFFTSSLCSLTASLNPCWRPVHHPESLLSLQKASAGPWDAHTEAVLLPFLSSFTSGPEVTHWHFTPDDSEM